MSVPARVYKLRIFPTAQPNHARRRWAVDVFGESGKRYVRLFRCRTRKIATERATHYATREFSSGPHRAEVTVDLSIHTYTPGRLIGRRLFVRRIIVEIGS